MPYIFLWLLWIFPYLFFLLPISTKNAEQKIPCLVGMCTSRHNQMLEEYGSMPSANLDYCLLLKDYLACLNDSFPTCLSHLDFHSAITAANQKWQKFQCINFDTKKNDEFECQFWKMDEEMDYGNKDYEYGSNLDGEEERGEEDATDLNKCAMFGQLHLRPFHSAKPEICKFVGARALFDNRFFLIQITSVPFNTTNPMNVHVISKVSIIIRPREGCIHGQKVYLADAADSDHLPGAFQDGTTEIGENPSKKVLEIVVLGRNRVDILLNYLATTIRIRKFENKFINIFIHSPRRLLNMHYDNKNLCADGCLEVRNKNQLGKHKNMNSAFCEGDEMEFCSKLFWEWINLPAQWIYLCIHGLNSSKPEMVQIWKDSFRKTFEDLFGKAKANEERNGTKIVDELKMKTLMEKWSSCPSLFPKWANSSINPQKPLPNPSNAPQIPISTISTSFSLIPSFSTHFAPSISLIITFFVFIKYLFFLIL